MSVNSLYGHTQEALTALAAVTAPDGVFNPVQHRILLEEGLVVQLYGAYCAAPTDTFAAAADFEALARDLLGLSIPLGIVKVTENCDSPAVPSAVEVVEATKVVCTEFGITEGTLEACAASVETAQEEEVEVPWDTKEETPAAEVEPCAPTAEVVEPPPPAAIEEPVPMNTNDTDGIPTVDDTKPWERVIGDLPQAFESLRPTIQLLVKADKLPMNIYTQIYSAANKAKNIGHVREFIQLFNSELPLFLNEKEATLGEWFEPWLVDVLKRSTSYDVNELSQASIKFLMGFVPDDRKAAVRKQIEDNYISNGTIRFLPEAVRRFKDTSTRTTVGTPVTWMLKVVRTLAEESEKDTKRPPVCDPELVEYVLTLLPTNVDRITARKKFMGYLAIGKGICMEEVADYWETAFPGCTRAIYRNQIVNEHLRTKNKSYLTTKEGIDLAFKEIIFVALNYYRTPENDKPVCPVMYWYEANAAHLRYISETEEEMDDIPLAAYARKRFFEVHWENNKPLLMKSHLMPVTTN